MVVTQASKLNLPPPPPSSSSSFSSHEVITSLLFEPFSQSLALMHSDSSILLFSSTSPPPPQQTLIPPYSTSSCFIRLLSNPNSIDSPPPPRILFIVAGPNNGGSRVLLRFWILRKDKLFVKPQVINCTHKDLRYDDDDDDNKKKKLGGVIVDLSHGFSVKLAGSVNFFALHSVSARKIWVFSAKMVGDVNDGDSMSLNLIKCAVIDCTLPIFSITISLGFLVLGEENGVRVFLLRPLVKGRVQKKHKDSGRRRENGHLNGGLMNREMCLPNGGIRTINGGIDLYSSYSLRSSKSKNTSLEGTPVINSNDCTSKTVATAKLRTAKLKQDSGLCGMLFVAFKDPEVQSQKSKTVLLSLKAVSVYALTLKRFLVLDSGGDLHLLSLHGSLGSEITAHMRHLNHTMKVQMLAVLPDISTRKQTFWVSDGFYTVQMVSLDDMDTPVNETDKNETEEKLMQISVIRAIFATEKVQDVTPRSTNAILVLGQGKIFVYANS